MEELIRSQKYDELAEYCEEEEQKVNVLHVVNGTLLCALFD